MDYWPSEEQELIQQSLRDFLSTESAPARVRDHYDSSNTFDHSLWEAIKNLGFAGTCIPAEYGGSELALIDAALVSEELGRHTAGLFLEGHTLAGLALAHGGSETQKQQFLPKLASGEWFGSLALASTADESKLCNWGTNPDTSGQVSVPFVPNADVADVIIVGCAGGKIGVLNKAATEVDVAPMGGLDQSRQLFEITFDASAVEIIPNFSGEQLCSALITLLAADAFGAAQQMLDITATYTKDREQFGLPLAQFQAVKHQLANFALGIVTARGLFWKAALEFDAGDAGFTRSAAMAKAHLCDQAFQTARGVVELHGGIGITWECDVQFYFKRAMFDRNYLGTPDQYWERCAELAGWNQ